MATIISDGGCHSPKKWWWWLPITEKKLWGREMEIKELEDRGIKVEWTFKGINKTRRQKNRQGNVVAAHATTITIPNALAKILSKDEIYIYIYEHFEKAVITQDEPPKSVNYKRIRLNNTSNNEVSNKRFELPNVFLDTDTMDYATITYYPNRRDYISNEKGLFLIDTGGNGSRKHIKRKIDTNKQRVAYDVYIRESNAPEDIRFSQDIKNIIPKDIFIYSYDNTIYMSDTQPPVECIQTLEENLINDMFKHHLIDGETEKIEYILCLDENDIFNENVPKIILNPV